MSPVAVKPEDVPVFIRSGTVTEFADIFNYTTAWLTDPKRATKEAQQFTAEDGVTNENWGRIATGLRRVAKDLGVRLSVVFKAGDPKEVTTKDDEGKNVKTVTHPDARLYAKNSGEYIALTPEEVAKRKTARRTNLISKLTAQYVTEGMTQENAEKRATAEVDKTPVV